MSAPGRRQEKRGPDESRRKDAGIGRKIPMLRQVRIWRIIIAKQGTKPAPEGGKKRAAWRAGS
jgi:hypothetical protein